MVKKDNLVRIKNIKNLSARSTKGANAAMYSDSAAQRPIHQRHPMPHRQAAAALQMGDAADVGADDALGLQRVQVAQLAVAQLFGQLWVEHAVGAGRAAAQV